MSKKLGETLICTVFILVGIILFYGSSIVKVVFPEPLTPNIYGRVISGLLVITTLFTVYKVFSKTNKYEKIEVKNFKLILLQIVLMIFYVVGVTEVGYFVTTFVYLTALMIILDSSKSFAHIGKAMVGSLIFTFSLHLIFKAFNVFLPNALFF